MGQAQAKCAASSPVVQGQAQMPSQGQGHQCPAMGQAQAKCAASSPVVEGQAQMPSQGQGHQCPAWCNELVILANPTDGANALKKQQTSLEDQVMYAWNRPTTDCDLEEFLSHRANSRFKDYPLIIIGGAHGYASALQVSVAMKGEKHVAMMGVGALAAAAGVSVAGMVASSLMPELHRNQWGPGFGPTEFREASILKEMSEILNIHYVDINLASYVDDFEGLWASYPLADLMICVCYGCATDLAKQMRNKNGLTHSLGKDQPNHYVSMPVEWNVKSTDSARDRINLLAKCV